MTITSSLYGVGALLAVLLLVVLAGRGVHLTGLLKRGLGNRLQLHESLALDSRRRLLLIRCDGRELLLLVGPRDLAVGWLPGTNMPVGTDQSTAP